MTENGWSEAREFIRSEIERIGEKVDCLDKKFGDFRVEFAEHRTEFKLKASLWGVAAGLLGSIAVVVVAYISKIL